MQVDVFARDEPSWWEFIIASPRADSPTAPDCSGLDPVAAKREDGDHDERQPGGDGEHWDVAAPAAYGGG